MQLRPDKKGLRQHQRRTLNELTTQAKHDGGVAIAAHLSGLLQALATTTNPTVALFASTAAELDTRPLDTLLLQRRIPRALPRIEAGELVFHLVEGPAHDLPVDGFGIPTPPPTAARIALLDCALVLVPGLGFDNEGGRIGYGRGYYDRALQHLPIDRVIGLFLDEQWVPEVPMVEGDVRLRRLCTPARGIVTVAAAAVVVDKPRSSG